MKFAHLTIVARDAERLAAFYRLVFGCRDIGLPRMLAGSDVSRGNGVPNSEIRSIWLMLPGVEGPFLEIQEYTAMTDRSVPRVNEPGFSHVAFEVEDIEEVRDAVLRAGGGSQGEIARIGPVGSTFRAVYMRDPEGNLIELEQA